MIKCVQPTIRTSKTVYSNADKTETTSGYNDIHNLSYHNNAITGISTQWLALLNQESE